MRPGHSWQTALQNGASNAPKDVATTLCQTIIAPSRLDQPCDAAPDQGQRDGAGQAELEQGSTLHATSVASLRSDTLDDVD